MLQEHAPRKFQRGGSVVRGGFTGIEKWEPHIKQISGEIDFGCWVFAFGVKSHMMSALPDVNLVERQLGKPQRKKPGH